MVIVCNRSLFNKYGWMAFVCYFENSKGTSMTKDEALKLALEALGWTDEWRPQGLKEDAITAIKAALEAKDEPDAYGYAKRLAEAIWSKHYKTTAPQWEPFDELIGVLTQIDNMTAGLISPPQQEAKDEPVNDELRRLHDLLGKANALARIRAAEIESMKASLYGLYELEKQRDELEQRLTKTEAQLGEAVWNYGELKREQLANQQNTSGSPIFSELHCICGAEWEWRNRDWELVTTPPQRTWVGLTDEEIDYLIHLAYTGDEEFVQTIEAKLKEKNLPCIKPEWIGLTEKEHTEIAIECGCMSADWVFYGAAVERKLKEKNT